MAIIDNTIRMTDRMTPVFKNMIKAMQSTLRIMEQVNRNANNNNLDDLFRNAQRDINQANNALLRFRANLNDTSNNTSKLLNFSLIASGINSVISLLNQANELIARGTSYLDKMALSKARLDLIREEYESIYELQDKILLSANNSRASYEVTANAVAKLGMQAKDAFKNTDEIIAFAEQLNKTFVISGTNIQGVESVMLQLTQAMASGKLQGEELNAILDNAQPIVANIQKYLKEVMNIDSSNIKKLASDGVLTADIIKNAMFYAADETNKKFESIPWTFEQIMTVIKNNVMPIIRSMSEKFTEFMNSENGQRFFSIIVGGFVLMAEVGSFALDIIIGGISFLAEVLHALKPVLIVVGVLLLAWGITCIPTLTSSLLALLPKIWEFIAGLIAGLPALWSWLWPILLIAAAIGILIVILNELGVTFDMVVGFVIGLLYSLLATALNVVIWIANSFLSVANFLQNLFIDPVGAVKMLIADMAGFILDKVAKAIKAIESLVNMIPGVNVDLSSGIDNMVKSVENWKDNIVKEHGVNKTQTIEYKNVGEAFNNGYNKGSNMVKNFGGGSKSKNEQHKMPEITKAALGDSNKKGKDKGKGKLKGGKLDEVGKINDDVSITDEDIKLLKDMASTQFVNQYTTLRPNMSVTFGDVKETADVNKIMKTIEKMAEEAIANAVVEGVV